MDTPIPTPQGWTRNGDLCVGDEVFDESGRSCKVTHIWDGTPRVAYRVTFSDGTWLDADAEHQWVTWTHLDRKAFNVRSGEDTSMLPENWPTWRLRGDHDARGPRVRSTQDIADTATYGPRGDRNHSIPVCGALDMVDADLPIPPYTMGVWLGDGTGVFGNVTIGHADAPDMIRQLAADGCPVGTGKRNPTDTCATYPLDPRAQRRDPRTGRMTDNGSMHSRLRLAGLLGNKHVPAVYLRASAVQRLAILQGLMDTDGSAVASSVEFCNTNKRIVDAVMELARSLGQKPVIAESRAMLNGKDCGPRWRVTWRPTVDVFRLPRKLARVKPVGAQASRNMHRMIVNIEPITPKPMRCITVDSPHHMYLAGDGMIPTHNTWSGAHILAEWILSDPEPGEWGIVAPTFEDGWATCVEGPSGIIACLGTSVAEIKQRKSPLLAYWNRTFGELRFRNGHLIRVASADDGGLRIQGKNLKGAWADEIGLWDKWEVAWSESLGYAVRLGRAQIIVTGTPKASRKAKVLVRQLLDDPEIPVRRLRTADNAVNLSPAFFAAVVGKAKGTRLERQELEGELIEDVEGALWTIDLIDADRVADAPADLTRVVVAVDPAVTATEDSDETGIIVVGEKDGHGYVIADYSRVASPNSAMARVVQAYHDHQADCVVGEVNNGGDYIGTVLHSIDQNVPYHVVRATRGKALRAEPVSALYEQHRVHHIGALPDLEDQMVTWTPDAVKSPDRLDAMVYAIFELHALTEMNWGSAYGVVGCCGCDHKYIASAHEKCPKCGTVN